MKWRVRVYADYCKGCMLCVELCPKQVFERSDNLNMRGYFVPEVAYPDRCVGCMLCEHICPDIAIEVEKVAEVTPRP